LIGEAAILRADDDHVPSTLSDIATRVGCWWLEVAAEHQLSGISGCETTGFSGWEPAIGGRWVQMLKEVAPAVARVGAVHHPSNPLWAEAMQTVERAGLPPKRAHCGRASR
jgi:hypothetical protein